MKCWDGAGAAEKKLFNAISGFLARSPQLLGFLFDPDHPRLRASPEELVRQARGLSSGDVLLVKIAVDLWSSGGFVSLHEIFDAEPEALALILASLETLAPKPQSALLLALPAEDDSALNSLGVNEGFPS